MRQLNDLSKVTQLVNGGLESDSSNLFSFPTPHYFLFNLIMNNCLCMKRIKLIKTINVIKRLFKEDLQLFKDYFRVCRTSGDKAKIGDDTLEYKIY